MRFGKRTARMAVGSSSAALLAAIAFSGCADPVVDQSEDDHHTADHAHDHQHNLTPPDQEPATQPERPTPSQLLIPEVDVASELLHLGLRSDGSAEVPEDFDQASWYEPGGRPGDGRPTVVLGHVDSTDGPAIFADIHRLEPGDQIEIIDSEGEIALYETDDIQVHPRDDFPTFEVFGNAREDVLRLVTCTGDFDLEEDSYSDNLIVFASRIDS